MTTYVFPGQGSQAKGMGSAVFDYFPDLVAKANALLGYSLPRLCLEDPQQQLNQTQYTQPALYVVNALTYLKKIKETNQIPTFVAGHSLGEYNALFAAGVFDFETGLKLVQKRGELMSQTMGGSMAAVIGFKKEQVEKLLKQNNLNQIFIANHNSHTQIVISGLKPSVEQAQKIFEEAGAMMVVPLKVSGAFHSPYMEDAQKQFEVFIENFKFSPPQIPVIANCTAKPYLASDIVKNITQQITNSVRWTESMEYLIAQDETVFEEIGSGAVLTGLIRRIKGGQ
jgi:malonyl CoA-acyl carrier protein transacylase